MFGIKLRSWMEAHIVRPRKKRSKEGKGGKGSKATPVLPDPPAKSALADPNPTAAHSAASPAASAPTVKRVTLVSPTPSSRVSHGDRGESGVTYGRRGHAKLTPSNAAGSSPRRPPPPLPTGAHHRGRPNSPRGPSSGPRYSTYLSSPESAYSTGYSTDATSPHGYSPGKPTLLHLSLIRMCSKRVMYRIYSDCNVVVFSGVIFNKSTKPLYDKIYSFTFMCILCGIIYIPLC